MMKKADCAILAIVIICCGPVWAAETKNVNDEKVPSLEQAQMPVAKKVESDANHDSTPDRFEYYEEGKLVRFEADSNDDGRIDEWGTVQDGKLVKDDKDTDGDGKPDKWITY
jgi:hypothetical protein